MGMKFTGYYTEEFFNNDDKYLFMYFLARNNPVMAEAYMYDINVTLLQDVQSNFIRYKEHAHVYDFSDIIERFIITNNALPVKVAIIDEAQDLTSLQWEMCKVAFKDCRKVYIAGDDDQAIYEWSGADVAQFLHIDIVEREILHQSYRLQKKILDLSKRISAMIKNRADKVFDPISDEGQVYFYNSINEIKINDKQTYYFLSRNNWFLSFYRDWLKQQGRVYIDKHELSYNPRHIEVINIIERARKRNKITETDEIRVKLFLKDKFNIDKSWFEQMNLDNDTVAYYKDLIRWKSDLKSRSLTVNTIHGVKGGEADNVVLMLDFTRSVQNNMEHNPDSELRCLYVACTRAKKNLHIVYSRSKNGYDKYINFNGG